MRREQIEELVSRLSEEDQVILIWKLLGQELRPWTEAQDLAALLGTLTCPEGHLGAFSHFFIDGTTHLVVDDEGKVVPLTKRFEKQDSFEPRGSDLDGYHCERCYKEEFQFSAFYVPEEVVKTTIDAKEGS